MGVRLSGLAGGYISILLVGQKHMHLPEERQRHRHWVLAALDAHEPELLRYVQRLLDNADQAADVVQDAFLRLCGESPATVAQVRQWLYTVCRNRAIDYLRKGNRMEPLSLATDGQVDRHADPAQAAEVHDSAGLVRQLLGGLPEPQREAVDLWAEGFSYREIARITGRTESNIRLLIHRAFKALRAHPAARQLTAAGQTGSP